MRSVRGNWQGRIGAGLALLLGALVILGCYEDYGLTYSDYDVVLTLYDKTNDFSVYKTFVMPDSVPAFGDGSEDVTDKYDELILQTLAASLEARGYQRLPNNTPTPPDLIVFVSKTSGTYYYAYGGYPWYGWYGGYYPYYPGYPYYPYYPTYVGSYATGTILVDMVDIARVDTVNKKSGSVWYAAAQGVAGDTKAGSEQRIYTAINQMFVQSPYLGSKVE